MRLIEQGEVGLPRGLRNGDRPRKPVRSRERKRTTLRAGEPAQHGVLPVRGVHCQLPDVVASRRRPPCRLRGRHATQRSAQVRAVPGLTVVRQIDRVEERPDAHVSVKFTVTVITTSTGALFKYVGVNCHCRTASVAA